MADLVCDFEWDARKADSNLKKHGVRFEQAASVFMDSLASTVFDEAHSQYEERWFTLGHTTDGAVSDNEFNQHTHTHYLCTSGHETGTNLLCG